MCDQKRWKWTRAQAISALRGIVQLLNEIEPAEYAMHSRRMGITTRPSAAGLSREAFQQERHWKSGADSSYDRMGGGGGDL